MRPKQWIVRSAKVLSGTPVFAGTRVPVQTLLEYLEAGQSIQEFLDDFPTVDYKHVIGALESLKQLLLSAPKRDLARGAEIPRTRSTRRPYRLSKHTPEILKCPPKIRRRVFSVEESKYELVLGQLRSIGWQPSQLVGRERTAYALNSEGTVVAILRNAMKDNRGKSGKSDHYFFGLSKIMFEKYISQGTVYVFLQCGSPSSVLIIPGDYFRKWFQSAPTSGDTKDWKINIYTDGRSWELKPSGKPRIDLTGYLNHYPSPS